MKLDYTQKGKVIIDMIEYVESMVKSFTDKDLQGIKVKIPWNDNLFKVRDKSLKLPRSRTERFHTGTAQGASVKDLILVLQLHISQQE